MTQGPRVLIVEDEPFILIMIEEMVADNGGLVAGSTTTCLAALEKIKAAQVDIAILDINLGAENCESVVDACRFRGIPIVFTTGYGPKDLPSFCAGSPVLTKPFSNDEFAAALSGLALTPEYAR